jgi:hypothetical protein
MIRPACRGELFAAGRYVEVGQTAGEPAALGLMPGGCQSDPTLLSRTLRSAAQCRRKTDETSPVAVEVVEETRAVVAEVVDDAKSIALVVVEETVEETVFVTVEVVEEVNPPPPPLSATGATPVGESVVKNRWKGPLIPGGSPLGAGAGAGDHTTTWLY